MAVKYVIDDETMTSIADPLRSLAGRTDELTPAEMVAAGNAAKSEVNTQTDLITQIGVALQGKAAPGGGITPTGTIEITENGTHDVTEYATAEVNVPSEEPVLQTKTATPNTTEWLVEPDEGYDGLSSVLVKPIPDGYVYPNGTKYIYSDGSYDVTGYKYAYVSTPQANLGYGHFTENGVHYASEFGFSGFSLVDVDVQPKTEELNITENGEYTPGDGVDGFSRVTVNVSAGTTETWTFTMEDGSEVTKDVVVA